MPGTVLINVADTMVSKNRLSSYSEGTHSEIEGIKSNQIIIQINAN